MRSIKDFVESMDSLDDALDGGYQSEVVDRHADEHDAGNIHPVH